jgi:D-alanyl-D-alanine carboxypeptidase
MLGGNCRGVKTGWTLSAGGCLAVWIEDVKVSLVVVLLGCDTLEGRFVEAARLIDIATNT